MDEQQTEDRDIVHEVVEHLRQAQGAIIAIAQANNNPSTMTTARQCLDSLAASFLFFQSMIGELAHRDQIVEEKVTSGDVVQFPNGEAGNAPEA